MMEIKADYKELKEAIAEGLALVKGDPHVTVTHYNEATGILWQFLTDEQQGELVMR